MPGPGQPVLNPGFFGPPTPFRPVDVLGSIFRAPAMFAAVQAPTTWYVRTSGSNNNGGTDTAAAPSRSGADGVTTVGFPSFSSATAAFTSADVGKGICINTGAAARHHKIIAIVSPTQVTLDRNVTASLAAIAWAIGGAWADVRPAIASGAVTADTNSPVACGDTVWVGAGTYRQVIVPGGSWIGQIGPPVAIWGDADGSHTGDAGEVILTAFLTDDFTAPSATPTFSYASQVNTRPIGLRYLTIIGGSGGAVTNPNALSVPGPGSYIVDCIVVGFPGGGLPFSLLFPTFASPFLIDRCLVISLASQVGVQVQLSRAPNPFTCGFVMQNTQVISMGDAVRFASTGAGAGLPGGALILNCALWSGAVAVRTNDAGLSTALPILVQGCIIAGSTGLQANAAGQIVEQNNNFHASTPRTTVSVGAGSLTGAAPRYRFGQERIYGAMPRPFMEPVAGSPATAFGAPPTGASSADTRFGPRPTFGKRWDVGPFQVGNNFAKETGTVHTGANAISIIGDGYQDFDLAVDAGPLTISVFCQYDTNYSGPPPQLQVVKGSQIGVGDVQVNFDASSLSAWSQRSITINPTSAGIVTVRLIAADDSGTGKTIFDTFAAA